MIPFERFNANLCFALAFCFVLSCLASVFFCFLSCKPPFLCVCVFLFLLHACRCLHLALIAKKNPKKPNQPNTNSGSHKSSSLNVPVVVDDLLPPPSLACCDWWLRCLAWAVLCGRNSSPKYGLLADRYHFCEKCFNEIQGESVSLGDDPSQPQT